MAGCGIFFEGLKERKKRKRTWKRESVERDGVTLLVINRGREREKEKGRERTKERKRER